MPKSKTTEEPKTPSKVGTVIDRAHRAREAYRKAASVAEALKKKLDEQEDEVLRALQEARIDMGRGKLGSASIVKTDLPQADDWVEIYSWIIKHKAPELLQRRISGEAYRERIAAGEKVPGVTIFTRTSVRLGATK